MKTITVGYEDKREVSELNHELFLLAQKVIEASADTKWNYGKKAWHIGYSDIGNFIDVLENLYEITLKDKQCKDSYGRQNNLREILS